MQPQPDIGPGRETEAAVGDSLGFPLVSCLPATLFILIAGRAHTYIYRVSAQSTMAGSQMDATCTVFFTSFNLLYYCTSMCWLPWYMLGRTVTEVVVGYYLGFSLGACLRL